MEGPNHFFPNLEQENVLPPTPPTLCRSFARPFHRRPSARRGNSVVLAGELVLDRLRTARTIRLPAGSVLRPPIVAPCSRWATDYPRGAGRLGQMVSFLTCVWLESKDMTIEGKKAPTKSRSGTAPQSLLDGEPYRSMLARTHDRASRALARYGEPRMSLQELRAATAGLPVSLSETVLAERRAGW